MPLESNRVLHTGAKVHYYTHDYTSLPLPLHPSVLQEEYSLLTPLPGLDLSFLWKDTKEGKTFGDDVRERMIPFDPPTHLFGHKIEEPWHIFVSLYTTLHTHTSHTHTHLMTCTCMHRTILTSRKVIRYCHRLLII